MIAKTASSLPSELWQGPGVKERRGPFTWQALVWNLVFPPRRHRIGLTVPGLFLMMTAMGIGTAAYNTANNILFIALSLLLACLLLSGLLSWFNFMRVSWRLRPQGPWRAGHEALVAVDVRNGKRWLPTYSLWFELSTQPRHPPGGDEPPEKMKIREILAAAEKFVTRGRVHLTERLAPMDEAALEWVVRPAQRGEVMLALDTVGSLFPFGFLKKNIGITQRRTVLVWPAQISYQWTGAAAAAAGLSGERVVRAGLGEDLLALRKYAQGDSHRLIHWKASARLGQLMVRQFSAEAQDGFWLCFDTSADRWTRSEQFEVLCCFAGSLAEDLFARGQLCGVVVNGGPLIETRRLREVEAFLDELARVRPIDAGWLGRKDSSIGPSVMTGPGTRLAGRAGKKIITFAPEGARGVTAYVDGQSIASA